MEEEKMLNKKELNERIAAVEAELKQLKLLQEISERNPIFDIKNELEHWEEYYVLGVGKDEISQNEKAPFYDEFLDSYTQDAQDRGLLFKTKEAAEFEAERQKVYQALRKYAVNYGNGIATGVMCDYIIAYDAVNDEIVAKQIAQQTGTLYFTEDSAEKAITEVGDELIKKYYLQLEG